MSRSKEIADAYRAVTVEGAWYGPTIAELLAKISEEQAAKAPSPGAHTISELLQHLLLWNERIRTTNENSPMPKHEAEKEWGKPAIPWNDLVSRWNKSRDLLERRMQKFPVEDLRKQTPGRNYSYESMLNGIVQHTIYHGGQIAMVLSMVKGKSGRK